MGRKPSSTLGLKFIFSFQLPPFLKHIHLPICVYMFIFIYTLYYLLVLYVLCTMYLRYQSDFKKILFCQLVIILQ